MKAYMIIASINELTHIAGCLDISKLTEREYHTKVIVVDEGDMLIRKRNNELLCDVEHNFYGHKYYHGAAFGQRSVKADGEKNRRKH